MKVYRYDKKTLDLGNHPLESDFLFETTQDVLFHLHAHLDSVCRIAQ